MAKTSLSEYAAAAKEAGATWTRVVPASYVVTAPWVRYKCHFGCGGWDAGLLCPPRTPTPAETAAVIACYDHALLAAWEAPPTTKARRAARKSMHRVMFEMERRIFLDGHYKALAFVAGPCNLCEDCDTDALCKRPWEARPAMEACGIDVFATMANAGFNLPVRTCKDEGHTQCGLVLID